MPNVCLLQPLIGPYALPSITNLPFSYNHKPGAERTPDTLLTMESTSINCMFGGVPAIDACGVGMEADDVE